jgi:hypothetical protein
MNEGASEALEPHAKKPRSDIRPAFARTCRVPNAEHSRVPEVEEYAVAAVYEALDPYGSPLDHVVSHTSVDR